MYEPGVFSSIYSLLEVYFPGSFLGTLSSYLFASNPLVGSYSTCYYLFVDVQLHALAFYFHFVLKFYKWVCICYNVAFPESLASLCPCLLLSNFVTSSRSSSLVFWLPCTILMWVVHVHTCGKAVSHIKLNKSKKINSRIYHLLPFPINSSNWLQISDISSPYWGLRCCC